MRCPAFRLLTVLLLVVMSAPASLARPSAPPAPEFGNAPGPVTPARPPTAQHPLTALLVRTDNALDVAIIGRGCFTLQTPSGTRYTRKGSFKVKDGALLSTEGFAVVTDHTPGKAGAVAAITPDGTLLAADRAVLGHLVLAAFPHPEALASDWPGLLRETPGSGVPTKGRPGTEGFGLLATGHLEYESEEADPFRQGLAFQTNCPLDLAIRGDGYFAVQTPKGLRYTRDGSLRWDAGTREIVTADGFRLLTAEGAPLRLPPGGHGVGVDVDGTVNIEDRTGKNIRLGHLLLTRFANPRALVTEDGYWYAQTDAAGAKVVGRPNDGQKQLGGIAQGFQEVPFMSGPLAPSALEASEALMRAAWDDLRNQFTPGYKSSGMALFRVVHRPLGAAAETSSIVFTQGQIFMTLVDTNLAVNGNGFLAVRHGQETRFTRDGRFTWRKGVLVDERADPVLAYRLDANGNIVEGPVPLRLPDGGVNPPPKERGGKLVFDEDGVLWRAATSSPPASTPLYRVALASFPNASALRRVGDTHFVETPGSGPPTWTVAGTLDVGRIVSGALEMSNVDFARESWLLHWADLLHFWARARAPRS